MNLKSFFDHWRIRENPFQAEEAKFDEVYLRTLADAMTHPDFEKIYGSPREVSTAVVFGRKGSGKTAMRLLMEKRYRQHNEAFPDEKVWVIRYDDLNPVLEKIAQTVCKNEPQKAVSNIRLVDHQDAILSLGVTNFIDFLLGDHGAEAPRPKDLRRKFKALPRAARFDLAFLAGLYDQPFQGSGDVRWSRLRGLTRVASFWNRRRLGMGLVVLLITLLGFVGWRWLEPELFWPLLGVGTSAAALLGLSLFALARIWKRMMLAHRLKGEIHTGARSGSELRRVLGDLRNRDLDLAPFPKKDDQDSRYELAHRFRRCLSHWGFQKVVVLIDRIDEPQFINGDPHKMRSVVWPLLNNKFLQQDAFGLKLLLPSELASLLNREDAEFFRQARLDKQNLIGRLDWTGATLYDVCTKRLKTCQDEGSQQITGLADLFCDDVSRDDIINALDQMRQPRDAFKFLYQVIQEHCHHYPDEAPEYKIPKLVLNNVRKRQSQRLEELTLGLAPA